MRFQRNRLTSLDQRLKKIDCLACVFLHFVGMHGPLPSVRFVQATLDGNLQPPKKICHLKSSGA